MKKTIAVLLALVFAFAAFTGCAQPAAQEPAAEEPLRKRLPTRKKKPLRWRLRLKTFAGIPDPCISFPLGSRMRS